MSLARLVVTAVRLEGRTKAAVARDYGVSRQWVHQLVRRYDAEGEAGLEPRSRRPLRNPNRAPDRLEDEIAELRKELTDQGLDVGAHTIRVHLARRHGEAAVPSVATIWRILSRRGFVSPQPQKRPKSSFIRFEQDLEYGPLCRSVGVCHQGVCHQVVGGPNRSRRRTDRAGRSRASSQLLLPA